MGLRNINSYMMEISSHLIEDIVFTTTTQLIAPGSQIVTVGSTDAMYVGAQIVVNDPTPALVEAVTITAVNVGVSFTATFVNSHATGTQLLGGTFPTQQGTDPLFTQTEVLTYLARAQNEFLARLPLVFAFTNTTVTPGTLFQPTPANTIELERVALGNYVQSSILTVASLSLAAGVVTATVTGSATPYPVVNQRIYVYGTSNDAVFSGVQTLTSATTGTLQWSSSTGGTLTATGGMAILLSYSRLYETTQEQIANRDPNWLSNAAAATVPVSWFEDRTGVYGWGIAPPPGANFPVELLYSMRGPATLGLLSTFLVPDIVAYIIKYKAMEYIYRKNGEQRSPQVADYCLQRFERGVAIVDRYLRNMQQAGQ